MVSDGEQKLVNDNLSTLVGALEHSQEPTLVREPRQSAQYKLLWATMNHRKCCLQTT